MKKNRVKTKVYQNLNPQALSLGSGIFGAAFTLLAIITIKFGGVADPVVADLTTAKIIFSILSGFIDGVIVGFIFAVLYNKLNEKIRH